MTLPRTITNVPGKLKDISEQVKLDGLNIIGDEQAARTNIHAGILEAFMDEGGQIYVTADSNEYAGLAAKAAGGSKAKAYDVVTLGKGNPGAELNPDDGDLVVQILLETGDNVVVSLAGMGPEDATKFIELSSNEMSQLTPRPRKMLTGFANLDQHLPRRRMGNDTKAVRNTHFLNGRLRSNNVRLVNVLRALREAPVEFDKNVPNTIAMVQVNPNHREDLAKRIKGRDGERILENQTVEDCGLAYNGLQHGTYFCPSDLDPNGPYIVQTTQLRSKAGIAPDPKAKINAATKRFMTKLKAARAAREAKRKADKEKGMLDAAMDRELRRQATLKARALLCGAAMPAPVAATVPVAIGDHAPERTRKPFPGRSVSGHLAGMGVKDHASKMSTGLALLEHDAFPGKRLVDMDFDQVVAFILTDEVKVLAGKASATSQRVGVKNLGGFAVAHALIEAEDAEAGKAFFAAMGKNGAIDSPSQALVRRLAGLTKAERSVGRVIDYTMQAWRAHRAGTCVHSFVDGVLRVGAAARTVPSANDNAQASDAAA
jgi:hypothetical protein